MPWPFHEPRGRPVKPKFAPLSSVMMVLQGPPMVAIETVLLVTAESLGEGEVSVHFWPCPGRKRRRTDLANRQSKGAVQGAEMVEDCGFRGALDQDILLGSGGCTNEGDAGKSCDSDSEETREEHCRMR